MVDWEAWVYYPGRAAVSLNFTSDRVQAAQALADDYIALGGGASPTDFQARFSAMSPP
jgi:hypothetical protein